MRKVGFGAVLALLIFAGVLWFIRPSERAVPRDTSVAELPSAETCKPCHEEIYNQWRRSYHARSIHEPTFRAMLTIFAYNTRGANPEVWGPNYEFCFNCHAPEVKITNNSAELAKQVLSGGEIKSEGVTCAICHSIEWVTDVPDPKVPIALDVGLTPPYHKVKRTSLFGRSELCSACHDYNNPRAVVSHQVYASNPEVTGVPCCTVNRDWKKTSYAREGITCQSCHMREERQVVRLSGFDRVKNMLYALAGLMRYRDDRGRVDHTFPGGRSEELLRRAVRMEIEAEPAGEEIRATVALTNLTGHSIPNG
ncbi:hypothetical protein HRbin10_00696 [bacterium HR10]|nr:hypothetical protein HRbin10_00696 [bacterium HR10]